MLCNIKPVPFHESDKHIFAKIPGGVRTPGPPPPPPWIRPWCSSQEAESREIVSYQKFFLNRCRSKMNMFKLKVFFPFLPIFTTALTLTAETPWGLL